MSHLRHWLVDIPARITEWWQSLYTGLLLLMVVVLFGLMAVNLTRWALGYPIL